MSCCTHRSMNDFLVVSPPFSGSSHTHTRTHRQSFALYNHRPRVLALPFQKNSCLDLHVPGMSEEGRTGQEEGQLVTSTKLEQHSPKLASHPSCSGSKASEWSFDANIVKTMTASNHHVFVASHIVRKKSKAADR